MSNNNNYHQTAAATISKKQRNSLSVLSQRAVLSSKRKIWDSNVVGMDAAESAVEVAYNLLRDGLLTSIHVGQSVYGAAKDTTNNINHSLLLPLKEYVLLPTFMGMEQVWCALLADAETGNHHPPGLELIRRTPWMGEPILAPLLLQWWSLCQAVVQFVSHSTMQLTTPLNKQAVRDSVDHFLTVTKTGLYQTSIAVQLYVKRLDANVTRTLMHTQWKVLGSGPYATLEESVKLEVLDHVCERYLARPTELARYELAAHIRAHNPQLYQDLFVSGLLQQRRRRQRSLCSSSGSQYSVEEWLSARPLYDTADNDDDDDDAPYLLFSNNSKNTEMNSSRPTNNKKTRVVPLMFRLPYINGERPKNDAPWQRMNEVDRRSLEQRYQEVMSASDDNDASTTAAVATCAVDNSKNRNMTKWYEPDLEKDVLIDQKRHAVSFFPSTTNTTTTTTASQQNSIRMMVRPTLWRFHGIASAEICRALWFVDTGNAGLQPYSAEAATILEDAYLFLKWRAQKQRTVTSSSNADDYHDDNHHQDVTSVLTVQVVSPDGAEQQLVQFSSLTQVTAISKTLGGAISLFKRRVYRGVLIDEADATKDNHSSEHQSSPQRKKKDKVPSSPPTSPMSTTSLTTIPEIDDADCYDAEEDDTLWLECLSPNSKTALTKKMNTPSHHLLALPPTDLHLEDEYQKHLSRQQSTNNNNSIDHLVFVVHGIGEMLRSTEVFGHQTPTIVDCCGFLRTNHAQIPTGSRVEYIPVEWHEAFCAERNNTNDGANVNDISLPTIPTMRHFANDVLMDVLYFMSPQYHDLIIQIVTRELNLVWNKFQTLHGYSSNTSESALQLPKVSIIGHSLGAIIAWDILDHQEVKDDNDKEHDDDEPSSRVRQPKEGEDDPEVSPEPGQPPSPHTNSKTETTTTISSYPQLTFATENVFFLGAPIAVFLMIRNNNNSMMMMMNNTATAQSQKNNNMSPTFCFPTCPNVFNIFHPYDPVAYRIEPLIHRNLAQVEPMIIPHGNSQSGFRVHYQTKRIWLKFVEESQDAVVHIFERKLQQFGLLSAQVEGVGSDYKTTNEQQHNEDYFGKLNQGRRIDYMLQEHEIETANEYVAALAAHSSYWLEKDLSLFVAKQLMSTT